MILKVFYSATGWTIPPNSSLQAAYIFDAWITLCQTGPTIEEIAQARLEAFKLKVQKQERLERLWTTHGSASRSKCSIWAPLVTHGNIVQRNKVSMLHRSHPTP